MKAVAELKIERLSL